MVCAATFSAMGSSSSKPRKGNEKPHHLPKVGSPENRQWEHETHKKVVFGSSAMALAVGAAMVLAVIGLLVANL